MKEAQNSGIKEDSRVRVEGKEDFIVIVVVVSIAVSMPQ